MYFVAKRFLYTIVRFCSLYGHTSQILSFKRMKLYYLTKSEDNKYQGHEIIRGWDSWKDTVLPVGSFCGRRTSTTKVGSNTKLCVAFCPANVILVNYLHTDVVNYLQTDIINYLHTDVNYLHIVVNYLHTDVKAHLRMWWLLRNLVRWVSVQPGIVCKLINSYMGYFFFNLKLLCTTQLYTSQHTSTPNHILYGCSSWYNQRISSPEDGLQCAYQP